MQTNVLARGEVLRSIRKLRIDKLRISESRYLGKLPMDIGIPPLKLNNA